MTLVNLVDGFYYPPSCPIHTGNASFQNTLTEYRINAAGYKVAIIFDCPKDCTIDTIGFRTGTVNTSDTVDVRLETQNTADFDPSGTLAAAGAEGSQASLSSNTVYDVALTTPYAASEGERLCAVVEAPTGFAGDLYISALGNNLDQGVGRYDVPFVRKYQGSWGGRSERPCNIGVRCDDGSWLPLNNQDVAHLKNLSKFNITSSSTPNEVGNRFQVPFACRVSGIWSTGEFDGVGNFNIYADATAPGGTPLASAAFDPDQRHGTFEYTQSLHFSPVELAANTWYRMTWECGNATNNTIHYFEANTDSALNALGFPDNFYMTEEDGVGGWTNSTAKAISLALKIDQIHDGAGGGGGGGLLRHPGMLGGLGG